MIVKANPDWGITLKPGFCGFITREDDIVGDGIEYFERFITGIPFCHAFIITETGIIEADAGTGVHRSSIQKYLGNKNCQCFVRMPIGWTEEIGKRIVEAARQRLGEKYGYGTIFADLLANTFFGHWLNVVTRFGWDRFVCWLFSNKHKTICSQLDANALKVLPYLRVRGCLRFPAETITPKQLGNDSHVFDPIIYRIS